MIKTVAIQGVKGSFHHIVSQQYFNKPVDAIECSTFDQVVDSLITKKCDAAIMALENSIAGSIIPNYAHINDQDLHITGEYFLEIQHNLMAFKEQTIQDIKEVFSHPMALLQCKEFFKQHPHIKLIEDTDTAEVAKRIAKNNLKGISAIAPKIAADIFGLAVLADDIQTIKDNATRFVIVQTNELPVDESHNKASIKFQLNHKRGSLAAILNAMSDCKMNLTKIQSLPVIETPWKYSFFVDVTFEEYKEYQKAISLIAIMAENFKVLGVYKNGRPQPNLNPFQEK